jgi:4-hydroxybenzoate polyprenyltransferase
MTKALRAAWEEFLFGGHLQCLGSIAILGTVAGVFKAPFPWGLPVATYAVSYAIYVYNRLLEVAADAATNPSRSAYIAAHSRALWRAFFVSAAVAVVVVIATASWYGALFLTVLLVCGLLYTNIFKSLTRFIPGFKSLYVALAFAALVFLPFVYVGQEAPFSTLFPFALWVVLNGAIMQIFLDVKDLESDAQAGLRTVPLLIGRKRTFALLVALTLLSAIPPLLWATQRSDYPREVAALALASLLSLRAFRIGEKGSYTGYLIESGKFISWPVLLALGRVLAV